MNATQWLTVGLLGQAAFSARFLVQWIFSEFKKRSIVPEAFWYLSIIGSALLLAYAVYREDPVFILGQSFGMVVYFRNLRLISNQRKVIANAASSKDS